MYNRITLDDVYNNFLGMQVVTLFSQLDQCRNGEPSGPLSRAM